MKNVKNFKRKNVVRKELPESVMEDRINSFYDNYDNYDDDDNYEDENSSSGLHFG